MYSSHFAFSYLCLLIYLLSVIVHSHVPKIFACTFSHLSVCLLPHLSIVEGNNRRCENPLFFRRETTPPRKLLYIYIYLTRNDLSIKLSHILRLAVLDIYLSVVTPIVLFVQIFDTGVRAHGIWMGFAYCYIWILFYQREQDLVLQNSFT